MVEADYASIGYFWAAVLGLVQGIAEFLPISSSGHLALVEHLGLGMAAPASFDVFLHLATLLVVLVYFRSAILWYLRNDFRVLLYVVVASVPTGLVGLLLRKNFAALRHSPTMICIGLLITACALSAAELRRGREHSLGELGWFGAFTVGCCQALALAPGISRSGSTIAGAMICGVDREEAFRFSFILSIPAVGGAVLLHVLEMARHGGIGELSSPAAIGPLRRVSRQRRWPAMSRWVFWSGWFSLASWSGSPAIVSWPDWPGWYISICFRNESGGIRRK